MTCGYFPPEPLCWISRGLALVLWMGIKLKCSCCCSLTLSVAIVDVESGVIVCCFCCWCGVSCCDAAFRCLCAQNKLMRTTNNSHLANNKHARCTEPIASSPMHAQAHAHVKQNKANNKCTNLVKNQQKQQQ